MTCFTRRCRCSTAPRSNWRYGPRSSPGAELVLAPRFSASAFWDHLRTYHVTKFHFIGPLLSILWQAEPSPRDGDHPARLGVGGAPRTAWRECEERFKFDAVECYGMTETFGGCVSHRPRRGKLQSVGKALDHVAIDCVDHDGTSVPPNERGQILIRAAAARRAVQRLLQATRSDRGGVPRRLVFDRRPRLDRRRRLPLFHRAPARYHPPPRREHLGRRSRDDDRHGARHRRLRRPRRAQRVGRGGYPRRGGAERPSAGRWRCCWPRFARFCRTSRCRASSPLRTPCRRPRRRASSVILLRPFLDAAIRRRSATAPATKTLGKSPGGTHANHAKERLRYRRSPAPCLSGALRALQTVR